MKLQRHVKEPVHVCVQLPGPVPLAGQQVGLDGRSSIDNNNLTQAVKRQVQ